ncbi:hypothetical protein T492DRAFT_359117 [Pavlovales sp. CCMP2436]|nr:hypothetical protein T492DRAFT_359117 [Pavlovales sp. CCMP2436]
MAERERLLGWEGGTKTDGERVGSIWRSFVMVAGLGALLTAYGQMYGLGARASISIHASRSAAEFDSLHSGPGGLAAVGGLQPGQTDLPLGALQTSPLSAPAPAANRTRKPFAVAERFQSVGKLQVYHGGNLEQPGELERAVAMRAYNGELVLTYANEAGTAWAANLIFSLRGIGIDHTMVIVMSKEHCDAMATSRHQISCGWATWDMEGCKADDGPVAKWAFIERLWFIRHHYLARLIRLNVNVMALDGDMILHGDPYAVLHSAAMGRHNMVITSDGAFTASEVNNGFLYLRNCTAGGQVERVLREVIYREMDVCRGGDRVFGANGSFWQPLDAAGITAGPHHIAFTGARDQKYYQDVLASAFCARKVIMRMPFSSHKVLDGRRFEELLAGTDIRDCVRFRNPPSSSCCARRRRVARSPLPRGTSCPCRSRAQAGAACSPTATAPRSPARRHSRARRSRC